MRIKKSALSNGIYVQVYRNNNVVEDFHIPQDNIYMVKKLINDKIVVMPCIMLSNTFTPITDKKSI